MPSFGPLHRRELIAGLRALGFKGPFSGGKHEFMQRGEVVLTIPNPHRGDIGRKLLAILAGAPLTIRIGEGKARVGGGTLPRSALPSVTLEVQPHGMSLAKFAERLRAGTPPVVGYISGGAFKIDLRTVFPRQDEALVRALRGAA